MREVDFKTPCLYTCSSRCDGEKLKKQCWRYLLMTFYMLNCGMPNARDYLIQLEPNNENKASYAILQNIYDNIVDFVEKGNNLYIGSFKTKTYKTTWAIKLMCKYFDCMWLSGTYKVRGYFVYVPDFIENMKNMTYKNTAECKELLDNLKNADVVIWDDLTNYRLTETEQKILNNYITQREMGKKANIFTGVMQEKPEETLGRLLSEKLDHCRTVLLLSNN